MMRGGKFCNKNLIPELKDRSERSGYKCITD